MSFINKIHDFFALGFHSSCHCTVAMSCWDSIDIRIWREKYFNSYRFYKAPPSLVQSPFLFHNLPTQADVPFSVFIFLLQQSQGVASLLRFIKKKNKWQGEKEMHPLSQIKFSACGRNYWREIPASSVMKHTPSSSNRRKSKVNLLPKSSKGCNPSTVQDFFFFQEIIEA